MPHPPKLIMGNDIEQNVVTTASGNVLHEPVRGHSTLIHIRLESSGNPPRRRNPSNMPSPLPTATQDVCYLHLEYRGRIELFPHPKLAGFYPQLGASETTIS